MRKPLWIVLFILAPLSMATATGQPPDRSVNAIQSLLDQPIYKHAHWGILAVDRQTGAVVHELNPDRLFVPASTTKLYTVATALDVLGAGHCFETPVYRRGEIRQGVLEGDLILVASGDLTLGGRTDAAGKISFKDVDHTYANGNDQAELTEPDPLAGLNELARQVAAAGIKRVAGEVLIDDRLFDAAESSGSGPSRVTPMIVNDNVVDFTIVPTKPGEPAKVVWRPQTALFEIQAAVTTVAKDQPVNVTVARQGERGIVIRGQIPAERAPLIRIHEAPLPAPFARGLFIEALRRAGVAVDAPLHQTPRGELPRPEEYKRLPRVAQLVSPPFGENVKLILKVSHNLHASTLPLLVASKQGKRTLEEGLAIQNGVLARLGVDVDTISFGGGAGGARADYVTPRATVQLLQAMTKHPDFAAYEAGLPVLGVDGTLAKVVKADSPARGKALAKTGTYFVRNAMNQRFLLTSKALAGYLTTASGRQLTFAAFVNNTHIDQAVDTRREGEALGRLCEIFHADSP